MPSIWASRDKFTQRCSCATEWLLRPAPTGPPPISTGVAWPQIRCPRLLQHLKVGLANIMPSTRALRGQIHAEVGLRDGVVATQWLPSPRPTGSPISDRSGLATDQTPPAVAASQSNPCIHHAQHKGLTRQNSRVGAFPR